MIEMEFVKKEDGDEFVILDRYPEIDYVLLKRNSKYQPYVAAWGYNEEGKYWSQGHYFERLADAAEWILAKEGQLIGELDKYEVSTFIDGYDVRFKIKEKGSGVTNIYNSLEDLAQAIIVLTKEFGYYRLLEIAEKAVSGLIDDDYETALEYCRDTIDMDEDELRYFGFDEEEDDE